tara:strand:+ start:359 stop:802 length:444 start_codon:yes stop_codon:yes gene_type:complete
MNKFLKLKIKACSLADEAHRIHRDESKLTAQLKRSRMYLKGRIVNGCSLEKGATAIPIEGEEREDRKTFNFEVKSMRDELREHRHGLRPEARASFLAYRFLRGMPYKRIENTCRPDNSPDLDRIQYLVERFGGPRNKGEIEEWLKAA